METVKKFGWAPDIVHLHGQITSLVPLYMKKAYKNDPVFRDAKIVYSMYNNEFGDSFDSKFLNIAAINDLEVEDLGGFKTDQHINLDLGAIKYADAVVSGNETSNENVIKYGAMMEKPVVIFDDGLDTSAKATVELYKTLLEA